MPPSKRALKATAALTETPPETMPPSHAIAKVVKGAGNNLYQVVFPSSSRTSAASRIQSVQVSSNSDCSDAGEKQHDESSDQNLQTQLVELHSRFRNKIWLKRGGFVVVDKDAFAGRDNKLAGEIINVVRDEKSWTKQSYWPPEFNQKVSLVEDSDEEESTIGKMPPSSESDEAN